MTLYDPDIERVAIALAWNCRICRFVARLDQQTEADRLAYWHALSPYQQDAHRYKASVAIAAFEERADA